MKNLTPPTRLALRDAARLAPRIIASPTTLQSIHELAEHDAQDNAQDSHHQNRLPDCGF